MTSVGPLGGRWGSWAEAPQAPRREADSRDHHRPGLGTTSLCQGVTLARRTLELGDQGYLSIVHSGVYSTDKTNDLESLQLVRDRARVSRTGPL